MSLVWQSSPDLAAVALFIVTFGLGMGSVPWLLVSEMFPANAQDSGAAVAVGANWLWVADHPIN